MMLPSPRLTARAYFTFVAIVTGIYVAAYFLLNPLPLLRLGEFVGYARATDRAQPNAFYTQRVQPVLTEHCADCHGGWRAKGNLQLDSYAHLMWGGRGGKAVLPGNAEESELIRRLTLPADDPQLMPPAGRDPISSRDVTVLKKWIDGGASGSALATAFPGVPPPVRRIDLNLPNPAQVAKSRSVLSGAVAKLQAQEPGILEYVSRGSADLALDAFTKADRFDDAKFAKLRAVAPSIIRADLTGTAIGDASADMIVSMARVEDLRLGGTKAGRGTMAAIMRLRRLKSLSLDAEMATDEELKALRARGIKIYVRPAN